MARLNFRLLFSLLAVCAVLVLAFWPGTSVLVQRQFWMTSEKYSERLGNDPSDFSATNGMVDDQRVYILLSGYNNIPVDARAVELMKVAAMRKSPALWAHTIRTTTMVPVPTTKPSKPTLADEVSDVRMESLGKVQLLAAQSGAKLDPNNVYFDLAEATALAKLNRWNEVPAALERGSHKTGYDDYVIDELERRGKALANRVDPVLPSEIGSQWSGILLPHLANFRSLTRGFANIADPQERFRASLSLARIGLVLEKSDASKITNLVGSSLVAGSARGILELGQKSQGDVRALVPQIAEKAKALGISDVAEGWQQFANWQQVKVPDYGTTDLPEGESTLAARGLVLLAICAGVGAALWLGTHVDPSAKNAIFLGCILMGVELFSSISVDALYLLLGMLVAGNMMFVGFLLVRLPGKSKLGYGLAAGAIALGVAVCVPSWQLELVVALILVWSVPFALSRWLRPSVPKWAGVVLATIFFSCGGVFLYDGMSTDPFAFHSRLGESIPTILAMGAFLIPILAALVMSVCKTNLPETLKLIAVPLPLLALCAAGVFVWGTRQMVLEEKLWQEVTEQELPQKYKDLMQQIRPDADPPQEKTQPKQEATAPTATAEHNSR